MVVAAKPLLELCANDLMSREVITLPREMSLPTASHLLSQARISGAPVVDDRGRCIGVLSSTDYVHWADRRHHSAHRRSEATPCYFAWQVLESEDVPRDSVDLYMTPDPITVTPSTPIARLAKMMLDAHIHRVIVVDQEKRPIGIVSSTDILAALAKVARE